MSQLDFADTFEKLTGNAPFSWQSALYAHFIEGAFPPSCSLPTGLGKTSVIPIWLIAWANAPDLVPRRLVYVVNRRTVVDQTTTESEKMRDKATEAGVPIPAISTLRGQFADNRAWSADPSRPAIIVGTVDMIGSRLLFSGYGVGFKGRPLHAGFLGQDVLLVHDEAHLEPAFQELIVIIEREQHDKERTEKLPWPKLRVMELTATSRGKGALFTLSDKDREEPEVRKRIEAKKTIRLHENNDEKKLAEEIAALALQRKGAVLVFVRKVEDVDKVVKKLPKGSYERLTGTLRGHERDSLVKKPIFQRFLPEWSREKDATPAEGAAYLVCTSAGEVGVNISADHLVCDLSSFESMAQRFGRVNRFGICEDTCIDVVYPREFEDTDLDDRRKKTLKLLEQLNGDGSPAALDLLDPKARADAFAPPPTILLTSEILFDAWALTTIRGKLPGRPMVEPYLHGLSELELPETHIGWREEVGTIRESLLYEYNPADLLEDYPLKPHELLREPSYRAFKHFEALAKRRPDDPAWVVDDDDNVEVLTLKELADKDAKDRINGKTVLLPPRAGGLEGGMLNGLSELADDVADEWFLDPDRKERRRIRLRDGDAEPDDFAKFRLVREIVLSDSEDEDAEPEKWWWYVRPLSADDDGSKTSCLPVTWDDHTKHVTERAERIAGVLLKDHPDLHRALVLAAKFHDLGKRREVWQRSIGNPRPKEWYAKSGRDPNTGKLWRPLELTDYRHEFGSLIDVLDEKQPYCAELRQLHPDMQDVVLHLIAVHHGYGRPHFTADQVRDTEPKGQNADEITAVVTQRFARLQRRYGRWGLAYLESLLRAADIAASVEEAKS